MRFRGAPPPGATLYLACAERQVVLRGCLTISAMPLGVDSQLAWIEDEHGTERSNRIPPDLEHLRGFRAASGGGRTSECYSGAPDSSVRFTWLHLAVDAVRLAEQQPVDERGAGFAWETPLVRPEPV